jgi:hypothetical protein
MLTWGRQKKTNVKENVKSMLMCRTKNMTALSAASCMNRIDPAHTNDERQIFSRSIVELFRTPRTPMESSFKIY